MAVLGMLKEAPRHPYEMQALIRERAIDRYVKMRGGSLYDTVRRLVDWGLIEATGSERQGGRPERTVYALTEAGASELHDLLVTFLGEPVPEFPRLAAGLAHILALGPQEAAGLLRRRAERIRTDAAEVEATVDGLAADGVPPIVLVEESYLRAMRAAEITWLISTATAIESGALAWIEPETKDVPR